MKKITSFFITIFFTSFSFAQTLGTDFFSVASDNASNYSTWSNGDNLGSGFGVWSFSTTGSGGHYYGATGEGNPSFGIFAGGGEGNSATAERSFNSVLKMGDRFSANLGHSTNIATGGEVLLQLLDNSSPVITLKFTGGGSSWTLNDGGSDFAIGQGYSANTSLSFTFTYNEDGTYSYTFGSASGNSFTASNTISGINGFRFQSNAQGGGENTGLDNLAIDSKYTVTGNSTVTADTNATIPYLDIQSGSSLNINTSIGVIVSGNMNNSGAVTLNSNSSSYSSLIPTTASGSGTVQYNRYTNSNANGNDLISSPLSSGTMETFGAFEGNNPNLYADGTKRLFGPFDNTANDYVEYDTATDGSINLIPAKGYRVGTNPAGTLVFTGSINVSDQNINTSSPAVPNGKWNLIGNPYPSYFNTNNFITTQDSKFPATYQAIYGWNGSAWTIINRLTSDDVLLAPGQGFFVASNGDQTFVFDAASRVEGSANDFVTTRNANEPNTGRVEISLNNATKSMKTDIYFNDNSTSGLDPGYDAGAFGDSSSGLSIFTNLVMDNEGVDMAIQSLSYADINNLVMPLGISALQGQQLTMSISTNELPSETKVYLEDNVTNSFTLLTNSDYVFTPSTDLSGTGRFFVHFTTGTLGAEDTVLDGLQIYTDNTSREVVIKGQLRDKTTAVIYDIQGRQVNKQDLNAGKTTHIVDVNNLSTGLYIVELRGYNQKRSQKVIIK